MEREVFAPWELQYAAELNAAQLKKEEKIVSAPDAKRAVSLLARAGWRKELRRVVVPDSEARRVSKYKNTCNTMYLFSEDQTEPVRHTRRQWQDQGRRVTASNSDAAEKVPSRDGYHTVHLFEIGQTEPFDANAIA